MKVTRITAENAGYFEALVPEGLFGDEDLFSLGAIAEDGTACAVISLGITGEMAYIEWIYTDSEYRRKGAARSLMMSVTALLKKVGAEVIEISFSYEDENLEDFLEAEGFLLDVDKEIYSVPLSDLIYSEMIDRWAEEWEGEDRVITASKLKDPDAFFDLVREDGIMIPEKKEELYGYSLVRMDRDENITGYILICRHPEGDIEIPYLYNDGSLDGAMELYLALGDLVINNEWEDENIVFSDREGDVISFVEQITDEDRGHYSMIGQMQGIMSI